MNLSKRKLIVERQVAIPVHYEEIKMDVGFRVDLPVDREVIVKNKICRIDKICL